ncbi:hypothetical protein BDW62DRAFT_188635 [Aspergillus aurantiobrunneus]
MSSDKSAPPHTPPPLPQGWVQKWDEQRQRAYFVDQNSGIAQWEYPTGSSKSSSESLPEKSFAELNHARHNTRMRTRG